MKLFTCDNFKGRYSVATAAVILAVDREQAEQQLREALRRAGLPQARKLELIEVNPQMAQVIIINDGNY